MLEESSMTQRYLQTSMTGVKRSPGFTLIEMMIVVALFSTAAVVLSQIFVGFNRLHHKVANQSILGQDMRFVMEYVVQAARTNQIDYASPVLPKGTVLRLITPTGGTVQISLQPSAVCDDSSGASCLAVSTDGGATWQPLTAKRVNVKQFDVYVRPTTSPFVLANGAFTSNVQPFVTVHLVLEYLAPLETERVMLSSQTSVSSRVYLR